MAGQQGKTIAIVGGGFSGSLLAFHLLNRCASQDRILLIERNRRFGLGLAYSTGNSNHLMNVRAGNMSAISERPAHFVEWLRNLPALVPTDIVEGRTARVHRMPPGPDRARERSRFFPGIAAAMADQWGPLLGERLAA